MSIRATRTDLSDFEAFDSFIANEDRSSIAAPSWEGFTNSERRSTALLSREHPYVIEVSLPNYAVQRVPWNGSSSIVQPTASNRCFAKSRSA